MAELLVRNRESWMEDLTEQERTDRGLTEKYNRRKKKYDIICVKQDGSKWSASELPNVVKIPKLSLEDAKKYEQTDEEVYLVPDPRIENFFTKEYLKTLNADNRKTEYDAKIANIISVKRKNLTTEDDDVIGLEDELLVKTREDLADKQIDRIEYEATMNDFTVVKISTGSKTETFAFRRYKIEDGKIIDKVDSSELLISNIK